ncbi:MAG: lysophospholipid acyltransferase family protein [Burkholderiaceae bacterium]|nr:lysophospholipid acyltransferase family protein [Burkholderiaceae bacterium]
MLVFLFKLLSRLPLGWVQALGGLLGRLVYLGGGSYARRLREHMALAGLDAARSAGAAAAEAGKQSLETAWVWLRPRADLAQKVAWADEPVLQAALADGRAVIILTPHLGCFEAIAQGYALRPEARTRPMTALYRRPKKDVLLPLVEDARAKDGLLLAPADMRGVRMLMRALKSRQVLGILPDQVPSQGDGVWAPFFGKPAYTMVLPAKLALSGNAIVLVLGAERLPAGAGFRIHVERLAEALVGDAATDAATINRAIEKMVLRFPLQYLWGYNRYKRPAGAPEATADDAAA